MVTNGSTDSKLVGDADLGIDGIDPASYTIADGDGQTTARREAGVDVVGGQRPAAAAHPFYTRLNQILDDNDFDRFVEGLCQRFYADEGRPGLPPGRATFGCC